MNPAPSSGPPKTGSKRKSTRCPKNTADKPTTGDLPESALCVLGWKGHSGACRRTETGHLILIINAADVEVPCGAPTAAGV
jgi:hypothetical protein